MKREPIPASTWATVGALAAGVIGATLFLQRPATAPPTSVSPPPPKPLGWMYTADSDPMRGTSTDAAMLDSLDEFTDHYGLHRPAKPRLRIEQRGRQTVVFVTSDTLQFTCSSYAETHVSVKFDSLPIERFGCAPERDSAYGVMFIQPGARFVARLRKAKAFTIEAPVYERGDIQFRFANPGLQWPLSQARFDRQR